MGFFSAFSILWETGGRRDEAVYSVFIRSFKALYLLLLKRGIIYIPNFNHVFFIVFYALLAYIYYEHSKCLKYKAMWDGYIG